MTNSSPSDIEEIAEPQAMPDATDWREAVVEPKSSPVLERLFLRRAGVAPRILPYIAPHSWAYRPLLYLVNPNLQALDTDLCRRICFVVARDNACRYCYGSLQTFLRVAGYSESELHRLEQDLYLGGGQSTNRDALQFAVRLSRGRARHEPTIRSLEAAGHSTTAIREIAGNAVLVTITNRLATMLAVPLDDDLESVTASWYFDLLQPIADTLLSGWQRLRSFPAHPLHTDDIDGPFAPWVARLAGTCAGRVLHDVVERWWGEDSALPRRTKLLILAVVAHGLSRRALTARVGELLAEQYDVSETEFKATVEHLRGETLQEQEEALLPLARESIRYEVGHIQQTIRQHVEGLSRAEVVDGVATLGLSNALARLDTLGTLEP